MNLLREIAHELVGMFLADARLSGAVLALVALVGLTLGLGLAPWIGGFLLAAGCPAVLIEAACREARRLPRPEAPPPAQH